MTIRYKNHFLTVTETWLSENNEKEQGKNDISIYYHMSQLPAKIPKGSLIYEGLTLITDLTCSEEELMEKIGKRTRKKIRYMEKQEYEIDRYDSLALKKNLSILDDFERTYNEFIRSKNMSARHFCKRQILEAYIDSGMFFITCLKCDGQTIVYHSFIGDGVTVRGHKSFSLYRNIEDYQDTEDPRIKQLYGMGNILLEWKDMLYFKSQGYKYYDWGGYSDLPELEGINAFKRKFGGEIATRYSYYVPRSWLGRAALFYIKKREETVRNPEVSPSEENAEAKRILHIIGTMNRGGAETFIMNAYRQIDRSKIQFDFLIHTNERCDYDDEIENLGGEIHRVHRKSANLFKNLFHTYKTIKSGRYDIVHVHSSSSIVFFDLFLAKMAGARVRIIHSHSSSRKGMKWLFVQSVGRPFLNMFSTEKWACSRDAAKWMYGEKVGEKAKIINNCIDVGIFSYQGDIAEQMKQELGLENRFVVGHVGRFAKVKNHEFLIEVFEKIHQRAPDSILLLVGQGDTFSEIQKKAEIKGLSEAVRFLGKRSDIDRLMQAMDVMLLPSLYEGFPVTLIEAQASGLPVLASDSIAEEVNITGLVEFISLKEPPETWADRTLAYRGSKRKNTLNDFVDSPYDVKQVANFLTNFYLRG